jgi:hypothetical protein
MTCTRREITLDKLQAGDTQIDQFKSFSYVGSIVNGNRVYWKRKSENELPKGRTEHSVQIKLFLKVN